MSAAGWVKLWRQARDSDVFTDSHLWHLFSWCLMEASHKTRHLSARTGRGLTQTTIGPGQFVYGRKTVARELKMPETTLHRRMKRLESLGCIVIQADTHFSLVTIVNWSVYQGNGERSGRPSGHPTGAQRTGNGQPTDTYKKGEKGKNREKGKNVKNDETSRDDHVSWVGVKGEVLQRAGKAAKTIPLKSLEDRSLILKASYLMAVGKITEAMFWDAVEAVKHGEEKRNAAAYFQQCLTEGATKHGKNLKQLLAMVNDIPQDVLDGNRNKRQEVYETDESL
jgi:hypothetical protein